MWAEVVASSYGFLPGNSANNNYTALRAAYDDALQREVPLYIPAGTYAVLLPARDQVLNLNFGTALVPRQAPLIGAGASLTILKFEYGAGVDPATVGSATAFFVDRRAGGGARIEGMQIVMDSWVGGMQYNGVDPIGADGTRNGDGRDAPEVRGVYVAASGTLTMIDVHTSGWKSAVHADGAPSDKVTMHLERCHILSRGTRVFCASGGLDVIDCVIDQDPDGYVFSKEGFYPGLYVNANVSLLVRGGRSLGNRPAIDNSIYAIYSQGQGQRVTLKDHYFGPLVPTAIEVLVQDDSAVLIDNCTFASGSGIYLAGSYARACTYHVTNCTFQGAYTAVGDLKYWTQEVEAHFTNCRFIGTGALPVIWRFFGDQSRPWYFSNCYFETTGTGPLVSVRDGVMIFHHCEFRSPQGAVEPVIQSHGRLEMYDCDIDAKSVCWFPTRLLTELKDAAGNAYWINDNGRPLHVVLERCTFHGYGARFDPYVPIFIRGHENEFNGGRLNVRNEPNDAYHDADGALFPGMNPELVQSDLQLQRASGTVDILSALEADGALEVLATEWSADWIDVNITRPVRYIFMSSDFAPASYQDGTANYPVGTTLRLHAVAGFTLLANGNIDLGHPMVFSKVATRGEVVSLRYSALHRRWVVI